MHITGFKKNTTLLTSPVTLKVMQVISVLPAIPVRLDGHNRCAFLASPRPEDSQKWETNLLEGSLQ